MVDPSRSDSSSPSAQAETGSARTRTVTDSPGRRWAAEAENHHPGLVSLPVRLPDAEMAGLLAPGDEVTVLATDAQPGLEASATQPGGATAAGARRIARGAVVLALPHEENANRVINADRGRLVIVGVSEAEAEEISAAAVRSVLTFSWDR